ncbi:globin [Ancylostoma caninum]|uniref:Globin n=1 Tax=Ancylostoma caninum TaxID=29170 RepID=A0A368GA29_ANCCA|nr:globin [Ancylostoma caninum]
MGAENSKNEPSLAEKRYKVDRPKMKKKAPVQPVNAQAKNSNKDEKRNSAIISADKRVITPTSIPTICSPTSETSDDPSTNESTSSLKKHFLCKRERMLLEHSWRKTRKTGSEHVGSKIFLMVLTAQPDIKAIFGMEKIPQGRLKYDPRFRQHATVFTKTFDYVIKNIDYPDKLETHFESLGRRHVVMQGRGFDPLYWETFAECMTQAAVEWEANRQRPTLGAWRTLVSTIIMFMRRGFDEENNKRRPQNLGGRSPRRQHYAHKENYAFGGTVY